MRQAITLAFCWAHLRRRFFDIAKDGSAPIASEALERIAALYAIERTIRGYSVCTRRVVRQEKSKPLVLALKAWFEQQLARVSAKSVIAEAIRYALHHWDGLTRFLDDGRIELGRVDDWRGGGRLRGLTVSGGFRPCRCRSSLHGSVSSRRSSNRAVRISRTRLSLVPSGRRSRQVSATSRNAEQPERVVQVVLRVLLEASSATSGTLHQPVP